MWRRGFVLVALLLVVGLLASAGAATRGLSLDDVMALKDLVDPRFSPDGSRIVYAVTWADQDADTNTSDLWMVPTAGGTPIQLTYQKADDRQPRWSPDGRTVAFLSDRDSVGDDGKAVEKRTQVWLLPVGGGEPWQLTKAATSVSEFDWSPDSSSIAFVAQALPANHEELEKRRKKGFDEVVASDHRMSHVWTIEVATSTARQLTSGDFDASEVAWSPKGDLIAFVSRPGPVANEALLSDLFVVPATGGASRKVMSNEGPDFAPAWSPDGSRIAFLSNDRRQSSGAHNIIKVVTLAGGQVRPVLSGFDYSAGSPRWSPDGEILYFATGVKTEAHIFTVPAAGGTPRPLTTGAAINGDFDVSGDGKQLAFVRENASQPADLYVSGIDGAESKQLTTINPQLADLEIARSEVIRWNGADNWQIEGILVKPVGYQAGQKYPLIVEAHGGPHGGQSVRFNPMWQYFAANGFMVLAPNFRGSGGYNQAFVDSDRNDWGGKDYVDIMNGVDHVVAAGLADPDRMGIEGWSYGGFMTSWIIGHTNRFKAAVAGAAVTNLQSFYGTTDIQRFIEWEFSGFPWDNAELVREHSPVTYAPKARTPTLILHGEADVRVPIEQDWQLYTILKKVGTTVEFVRYPREGHGLREPAHVRNRYERTLAWFTRFLTAAPTSSSGR